MLYPRVVEDGEGNLGLTSKLTQMRMPEAQLWWEFLYCSTKYTVCYFHTLCSPGNVKP